MSWLGTAVSHAAWPFIQPTDPALDEGRTPEELAGRGWFNTSGGEDSPCLLYVRNTANTGWIPVLGYAPPAATLTLTAPNGGEAWAVGSTHNITWTSTYLTGTVELHYSTDGGTTWTAIATGETDDGTYAWTVPNAVGANVKVRVRSTTNNSVFDASDAAFTITAGFTPAELTTLKAWYKAEAITGLSSGGAVASWPDSGPLGRTLTQATAGKKPSWVTNAINSTMPAVRFDGNDWLASASFTAESQPVTYYLVVKRTDVAATRVLLDGISSTRQVIYFEQTNGHGHINAGSDLASSGDTGDGSWAIIAATFDGASSALRKDGAVLVTGDAGASQITGYTLGARYDDTLHFLGDVAEVVIDAAAYDARVRAYLAGRYGL